MAIDPTAAANNSAAATGRTRMADSYETFMSLLTAQIKNQDPLSPMDSTQFTQQLVQMTGVEQQLLTNDLLEKLVTNTGSGIQTSVSLLGRDVRAINSDAKPSLTFEYFVRENLGVEVLAAWPFQHDISVKGVGRVGSTKHLPPTVSLQYHFNDKGVVSPVLGVGLNYTTFFSEDTRGALDGTSLKLGDSWGLAAHAGLDFRVSEKAAIRVDVRWIDIDSRVRVDGARMGTANIDPLVYGAAYVMKF